MENQQPVALLSVHDRDGIVDLAKALLAQGMRLCATGGTKAHLAEHGIEAQDVGELTGYPALFDGRVKTLHPAIFGGILADRARPEHVAQAREHHIPPIKVVVVNLYPFEETIAQTGVTLPEAIEQIDIGGVSLIRAAAKNFAHVTVVTDPAQYAQLQSGAPDFEQRRQLAALAFTRTADYDAAIARYIDTASPIAHLPGSLTLRLPLAKALRYGENPQSAAAFYLPRGEELPEQLHGKELSYNNLLDLDATLRLLVRSPRGTAAEIRSGAVRAAIVKHTVPCGVAEADSVAEAVGSALLCDPVSAFGGIVAVDSTIDLAAAEKLADFFLEIVAAPAFEADALERLQKKKNLRILRFDSHLPERLRSELRVRTALRGILAEDDDPHAAPEIWKVVSARQPTAAEWTDLTLAWDIVRHVKSNGIVVVRDQMTRGICAGQTNRVSAVGIAAYRAKAFAQGAACASDGFFPFADGLEEAAKSGCTAIIAPSGSIRDAEVIASADALGVSLVFSSRRYFLH
jgi:phosphoribosylaminoimidazolecarboxamide formyltransferase/IMP cyclohydrolase